MNEWMNKWVLLGFRNYKIPFVVDVEAIFHQVKVQEFDMDSFRFFWKGDSFRFLWTEDPSQSQRIGTFQMIVHT